MKIISEQQIDDMLAEMSPAQVRERIKGPLHVRAQQRLAQAEREEAETDALLTESARVFNENTPPAPALVWPQETKVEAGSVKVTWFKRSPKLSNGILSFAALILAGFAGLMGYELRPKEGVDPPPDVDPLGVTRGISQGLASMEETNKKLYEALIDHGMELLKLVWDEHGPEKAEMLKEAHEDFLKAHELRPTHYRAMMYLVKTYEALGDTEKAAEYEKRSLKAQEEEFGLPL